MTSLKQLLTTAAILLTLAAHAQFDSTAGNNLYFNGFSSYVDTRFTEHLKKFTVEAWVKSPNSPTYNQGKGPVHYEKNFQFNWDHVANAARGAVVIRDSLGSWHGASFGPLEGNRWYHLAATYDGDTLKAYTNGRLITANGDPVGPPTRETASLKLGKHAILSNPQYEFHNGNLDEVRVWDRVLSIDELRRNMHLTLDTQQPGLKLYFQLNSFMADSTLEAVSGRYSARLIQNPRKDESTIPVAKGTVVRHRFTGGMSVSTANNAFMSVVNAQDSITAYLWELNDTLKGTAPNSYTRRGPARQYIMAMFDSTAPYDIDMISFLMDSSVNRLLTNVPNNQIGLYTRPHYSDGQWTRLQDSATAIAWGSGFVRYSGSYQAGQFTMAQNPLVSLPKVSTQGNFKILQRDHAWVILGPTTDIVLYNASGQELSRGRIEASKGLTIPHDRLAAGAYFLRTNYGTLRVVR